MHALDKEAPPPKAHSVSVCAQPFFTLSKRRFRLQTKLGFSMYGDDFRWNPLGLQL